jgi:hypothetical protein
VDACEQQRVMATTLEFEAQIMDWMFYLLGFIALVVFVVLVEWFAASEQGKL